MLVSVPLLLSEPPNTVRHRIHAFQGRSARMQGLEWADLHHRIGHPTQICRISNPNGRPGKGFLVLPLPSSIDHMRDYYSRGRVHTPL